MSARFTPVVRLVRSTSIRTLQFAPRGSLQATSLGMVRYQTGSSGGGGYLGGQAGSEPAGSIRSSGGSFARREAAEEELYIRRHERELIERLTAELHQKQRELTRLRDRERRREEDEEQDAEHGLDDLGGEDAPKSSRRK